MAYGPVNVSTDNELTKEEILNKIKVLDIAYGGTGKATADEAFGSLGNNFGFPNAKNVGDNTDLNTLTKSGFYFSAGSKNTTNTTNIPQIVYDTIKSYYELNILVFGLANRVTQIVACPYNNNTELYERMWVRTGVGTSVDSLSWSDWREIFNSKQYLPIANGGTGAGTADTARKNLNAQRRFPVYVNRDGADLDTDTFDFILTALTATKHKALRDLGFGTFAYVWQYFSSGASNTTNRVQFAKGYITDKIATRYYNSSTSKWSDWNLIITNENLKTIVQDLIDKGEVSMKHYVIGSSGMTSETIAKNVKCTAVANSDGALFVGKWVPKHDGRVIARISLTRTVTGMSSLYTAAISNRDKPVFYGQEAISGSTNTIGRFSPMFDVDAYTAGTILTDVKYPTSFTACVTVYSPGQYDVLFDVEAGKPITFWAKKDSNITDATINIMYKEV